MDQIQEILLIKNLVSQDVCTGKQYNYPFQANIPLLSHLNQKPLAPSIFIIYSPLATSRKSEKLTGQFWEKNVDQIQEILLIKNLWEKFFPAKRFAQESSIFIHFKPLFHFYINCMQTPIEFIKIMWLRYFLTFIAHKQCPNQRK